MRASLVCAGFADGICSLLVALGLATRLVSFFVLINLSVVYFIVENALSIGRHVSQATPPYLQGPPPGAHMELVFVYLVGYLLLTIVGGGAFSLDRKLGGLA
jgi:putative oxidoreductase